MQLILTAIRGLKSGATADAECLDRLGLTRPRKPSEWFYAALVRGALAESGANLTPP